MRLLPFLLRDLTNVIFSLLQVAGTVVLGIGIWIASDRHSFISLTELINNEELRIQVSNVDIFGMGRY
jgi:hypothetical protein